MTDTPNKGFHEPLNGSTGWDLPLNQNFTLMDTALGSSVALAVNTVVSPTPVPLLLAQYQCMTFLFTGALSVDATYEVPAGVAGQWVCINNSTGAHTITISQNLGGPTVVIPQGTIKSVYTDGSSNGVVVVDTQFAKSGNQYQIGVFGADHVLAGSDALRLDVTEFLVVTANTAATNVVKGPLHVVGTTSGTPAAGIGVGIGFEAQTGVSTITEGMRFQTFSTDITPGSEDFDMFLGLMRAGAMSEAMHLDGAGNMTINATYGVIMSNKTQSLGSAGVTAVATDDGTVSSGTYTPTPAGGNFRRVVNNGSFLFAAPSYAADYSIVIQLNNGASAGTVTLSGFNKTSGSIDTVVGHNFFIYITRCNNFTYANVVPLQ